MNLDRLIAIIFALIILFMGIQISYTGMTSDYFVMPGMIHKIKTPLRYILGGLLIIISINILFSKKR